MSDPINFVVTAAGKNALHDASDKSIKLSLTSVGLGSGQYNPSVDRTAMVGKFSDTGISAGGVDVDMFALRFTVIMNYPAERAVSELGLYTSEGVLFAIASRPTGSFFRLYPSIDYVANFGLVLENTDDMDSIDFVLDGRAGQAAKIMQDHLSDPDPHPQYKDYAAQILGEHIDADDPHPQYAKKSFVTEELKKIDVKINSLMGITEYLFPPVLEAGYGILQTLVANRQKGANYSWLDRSIVYHYCPEGGHEAWSTTRAATQISTTAFNRSGTNRIGYNSRANYLVIDTEKTLIARGFVEPTNQLANEIKSGVFEAGEKLVIQREAWETLDYTSNQVAILITPEGSHEAWSITRYVDRIEISIFNRSGTNRVGYSGRVNWSLFKVNSVPLKRDKYPFNLMTGVSEKGSFTIPAPAGFDFTDSNFFPMITPEGGHEAWSITRTAAGFKVEVFNRSGTSRVGYTGKVSWAVFMLTKSTTKTILKAGTHNFKFLADRLYRITVAGGGGSGGNAIYYHSGATALTGEDGGTTTITAAGFSVQAWGGKAGTRGCWNNGSAYRDGKSGLGGTFEMSNGYPGFSGVAAEYEDGTDGTMAQYNAGAGGISLYTNENDGAGAGGKGKSGSGSRNLGFGGSGGGAGSGQVTFTCTQEITAQIVVGAGGKFFNDPEEYYQKNWHYGFGEVGKDGIVIIEESDAA